MIPASIRTDIGKPIGRVHPFLFGQFIEHFPGQVYGGIFDEASPHSDSSGFRTDVLDALRGLQVPLLRWPGGCYASAYHWQWGAGPRAERKPGKSPCWNFQDSHRFGTTEFVELCRRIGAEPLICVGMGRRDRHPTPEEAAAWVRYCNAGTGAEAELRRKAGYADPLNVTHWGLGNEVFAGIYDRAEDYGEDLVRFAEAMRKADPRLRFVIVGAEQHWLDGWNERLLQRDPVVRSADWIAWHDYLHTGMCEGRPDGAGKKKSYEGVMEHLVEVEETIGMLARLNREASARAGSPSGLSIAVDEWNELGWELFDDISKNDLPESYTLAHALYTAGFLNVLIRHANEVGMAAYSPAVNTRGVIFSGPRGVILRSTYHVFRLYRGCGGGRAIHGEVECGILPGSGVPVLDASFVLMENNVLKLPVVNRHPEIAVRCRIDFPGFAAGEGEAAVLTAKSLDAYNDYGAEAVAPVRTRFTAGGGPFDHTFPPRSLSVLSLKRG